jgi:RNA polymerase sigma factor (sigma-70 family)
MGENDWLALRFADSRAHLRAVAYRMLGSTSEAEDAVQEAWLKLSRSDPHSIENLGGWLTTVVARVCLDMLRARRARREEPLATRADAPGDANPEADYSLADSIGPALVVALEKLDPAERVAFVLHDMFDLPFDQIARIVDRTPAATRQLASRARRRLRGSQPPQADVAQRRLLVSAFLAAARDGNFLELIAMLSPDALLCADDVAVRTAVGNQHRGAPALAPKLQGATRIAEVFKGRARAALPATIDNEPGAVWVMADEVRAAFVFAIEHDRIVQLQVIMDPGHLARLKVVVD